MDSVVDLIKCPNCHSRLEQPVLLPCGTTICLQHINAATEANEAKIECHECHSDHPIVANQPFPANKIVESLLKQHLDRLDFGEKYSGARQAFDELSSLTEKFEKSVEDPKFFIHEYFAAVKNKVDFFRENFKLQIDHISEKLVTEIDAYKRECQEHLTRPVDTEYENVSHEDIGRDCDSFGHSVVDLKAVKAALATWESELKMLVINESLWSSIESEASSVGVKLSQSMLKLQHGLLLNRSRQFETKFLNVREIFSQNLGFNAHNEGRFQMKIENLSKHVNAKEGLDFVSSDPHFVFNLPFKINAFITPFDERKEKHLGFYVSSLFSSKFRQWSLDVDVELVVKNYKATNEFADLKKTKSVSLQGKGLIGIRNFADLKTLMNEQNGFYKRQDDSLTLEVLVIVKKFGF